MPKISGLSFSIAPYRLQPIFDTEIDNFEPPLLIATDFLRCLLIVALDGAMTILPRRWQVSAKQRLEYGIPLYAVAASKLSGRKRAVAESRQRCIRDKLPWSALI